MICKRLDLDRQQDILLPVCIILLILSLLPCVLTGCGTQGVYSSEVSLSGGSGKASVTSPCKIEVTGEGVFATIEWSSPHYDYMIVDGKKYERINEEGNSVFRIPIPGFDSQVNVIADTTAMSTPHEIEYTLSFGSANAKEDEAEGSWADTLGGIRVYKNDNGTYIPVNLAGEDGEAIDFDGEVLRDYATMFSIAYSRDGYSYIHIEQTGDLILVPEGRSVSVLPDAGIVPGVSGNDTGNDADNVVENATESDKGYEETEAVILCKPIKNIYLVSTSAMDIFAAIDSELKNVRFCSLDKKDWYVDEAVDAMDAGTLTYAGKYSAPDYELLLKDGCDLAIENTMIYHKPEIIDKLNDIGIPVMVEASSYEPHPMGRVEWIKLYGELTDERDRAGEIFTDEEAELALLPDKEETDEDLRPTVAFFYVTGNGAINVRKSGDYVSRMIEIAGGEYIPASAGEDSDNALSTVNMQMEVFLNEARDADILIYNGTIDGQMDSMEDLIAKDELFADFAAVKSGRVYSTGRDMYQESMNIAGFILDLNRVTDDEDVSDEDLQYLHRL